MMFWRANKITRFFTCVHWANFDSNNSFLFDHNEKIVIQAQAKCNDSIAYLLLEKGKFWKGMFKEIQEINTWDMPKCMPRPDMPMRSGENDPKLFMVRQLLKGNTYPFYNLCLLQSKNPSLKHLSPNFSASICSIHWIWTSSQQRASVAKDHANKVFETSVLHSCITLHEVKVRMVIGTLW